MNVQLELDLDTDDLTFGEWVASLPLDPWASVDSTPRPLAPSRVVTKPVESPGAGPLPSLQFSSAW